MAAPLAELRGIVKTFPGVVANAGVDVHIFPGEILALLGENGAGKSTLMSVLAGLYRPDAGAIYMEGKRVDLRSPRDALARGIGMVYQHFRLIEPFTVAENVLLGWREPRFLLDSRSRVAEIEHLAREHGLPVDPRARVWQLSVGERQRVEILKILYRNARVVVLDEPTAVLTPQEVEPLFFALRQMTSTGRAVVFISHKLDEVMALADRIVILRAGRVVGSTTPGDTSPRALAGLMVGHDVEVRPKTQTPPGPVMLEVRGLTAQGPDGRPVLRDASLCVSAREILGIAGVAGNGQRELAEAIAGLRRVTEGRMWHNGVDITRTGPKQRAVQGIAYIPEDRLREGLVGPFTLTENTALRGYDRAPIRRGIFMRWQSARAKASSIVERFHVRPSRLETPVRHLSGGNQQRLLAGREASRGGAGGRPSVLIAAHPTRGLDVEATAAMHRILFELRDAGTATLLFSESLDELLAVSDRIAVMHRGRIVGERAAPAATREAIGLLMTGASVT
jgi:general nucleoside transport system ATP-binding protein